MESLESLIIRAVQAHQQGRLAEATALYRRVLDLDPDQPQAYCNLGVIQRSSGQTEAAEASYRKAISIKPDYADAHTNLANLLRGARPAEALVIYEHVLSLKPSDANILYNYAATLLDLGRISDAIDNYRRAVAIRPQFAEAWNNLGVALADLSKLQEAIGAYRRAITLKPGLVQAYANLGLALQEQGLPDEAILAFDKALALGPNRWQDRTNRIFAELYHPGVGLSRIAGLSKQPRSDTSHACISSEKSGRPKLGFVSADFRHHAVGLLVIPALEGLRRMGFEITCYSNSARRDAVTERFMHAASSWREVWSLSDEKFDAQIRADGIDVLFDLSGYSRGHRLSVFARRPAPIQIAWAGYPATTGLPTMDYLLTDNWQTPAGSDDFFSERLLRLTHPYICYEPDQDVPEPGDLPAVKNGFITFGSFNALKKINAEVIDLWSRILARIARARLLLKSPAFDCPDTREMTFNRFEKAGVARSRLEILGGSSPRNHMAAMRQADIALDTFPYSGGLTTLEKLWMGLPVIALPGETMASRHSLSYLNAIGLGEFAVSNANSYVDLAEYLAHDLEKLDALRQGMRARIMSSPLTDRNGFCAELARMLESIVQDQRD